MSEIIIPQSLEDRMKAARRGTEKSAIIQAYLSPLLLAGERMDRYRRDKDGRLIAVTKPMEQPDPAIPDAFKPKRKTK